MLLRRSIAVLAWFTLALMVFATLSPIGLRPGANTGGSVGFERFAAYALLGSLFVAAYPRHFIPVSIFILGVAISLELLQQLTPDRHGRMADAAQKLLGGIAGCSFTRLIQIFWRQRS